MLGFLGLSQLQHFSQQRQMPPRFFRQELECGDHGRRRGVVAIVEDRAALWAWKEPRTAFHPEGRERPADVGPRNAQVMSDRGGRKQVQRVVCPRRWTVNGQSSTTMDDAGGETMASAANGLQGHEIETQSGSIECR